MPDAAIQCPSPNCGERRDGARPDLIVLHYTAMDSAEAALERLCEPQAEVSAHYLIGERGHVWRMVDEELRAWHAGAGQWGNVTDVNSRSIGIELANTGDQPFAEPQMAALESLMREIMERWNIPPERVIGHSDMAPDRKFDPGMRFDWQRLARQGLSVWPDPGEAPELVDALAFRRQAGGFGYPISVSDEALLHAFRMRFRPWAKGDLSADDLALITDLARRYPVDRGHAST